LTGDTSRGAGHEACQQHTTHSRKIGIIALLLVAACHSSAPKPAPTPVGAPGSTTLADKTWLLEASGPPVHDTTVAFAAGVGRTIVLRHEAPDDAMFLILEFPRDSTRARDSVHVRVHPVAGKYAFALVTQDKLGAGARATFVYAMHFRTPADAIVKYPSPGRFEQLLSPAELTADNKVKFLAGTRPAADMLRFGLAAAGSYGLVALR